MNHYIKSLIVICLLINVSLEAQYIRFADFNKGSESGLLRSVTQNPVIVNDSVFYISIDDGIHGRELWVSDGTPAGTRLLKDINPGPESSNCKDFIDLNGTILFSADDGIHGHELWATDGTEAGTRLVLDFRAGPHPSSSFDQWPWNDLSSGEFIIYDDILYYGARELMRTDGTTDGTYKVRDLNSSVGEQPRDFLIYKDSLYFVANSDDGISQLMRTDGTELGTVLVDSADYHRVSNPEVAGDLIFMGANSGAIGSENRIAVSDGTAEGTFLITPDPDEHIESTVAGHGAAFFLFKDQVFFKATTGGIGNELWTTDGTRDGTNLFLEINQQGDAYPQAFIIIGELMYFKADDGIHGRELWVSDGTPEGTELFLDINPGPGTGVDLRYDYFSYQGEIYFPAQKSDGDIQLWATDGTVTGTREVVDIGIDTSSFPANFFTFQGMLYCSAYTEKFGTELYLIDENVTPWNTKVDVSCAGDMDGSISVTVDGATPPYDISWSNDTLEGYELNELDTGVYVFTVIDSNGFEYCDSVRVQDANALQLDITASPAMDSLPNGSITLMAQGGVAPYLFEITSESNDSLDLDALYPGLYTITVRDSLGCMNEWQYELENMNSDTTVSNLSSGIANTVLKIYPNPTNDNIHIDVKGLQDYSVSLFDLKGRRIKSSINSNRLMLGDLPKGNYLIEIKEQHTGHKVVRKIVVEE